MLEVGKMHSCLVQIYTPVCAFLWLIIKNYFWQGRKIYELSFANSKYEHKWFVKHSSFKIGRRCLLLDEPLRKTFKYDHLDFFFWPAGVPCMFWQLQTTSLQVNACLCLNVFNSSLRLSLYLSFALSSRRIFFYILDGIRFMTNPKVLQPIWQKPF